MALLPGIQSAKNSQVEETSHHFLAQLPDNNPYKSRQQVSQNVSAYNSYSNVSEMLVYGNGRNSQASQGTAPLSLEQSRMANQRMVASELSQLQQDPKKMILVKK